MILLTKQGIVLESSIRGKKPHHTVLTGRRSTTTVNHVDIVKMIPEKFNRQARTEEVWESVFKDVR